jgi:transglutaminase-like putative cysteine protease
LNEGDKVIRAVLLGGDHIMSKELARTVKTIPGAVVMDSERAQFREPEVHLQGLEVKSVPMRLKFDIKLTYEAGEKGADFVFNIEAAQTLRQRVVAERLILPKGCEIVRHVDPATRSRFLRVLAPEGPMAVRYTATVDIDQHLENPSVIGECAIGKVPGSVLPYVFPSRYCQSDRLLRLAYDLFGKLPHGYARVQAICNWVSDNVAFASNTTNGETSACDTVLQRQGVCRDFAHLMIALCRALNIPARFATGIDYGADPALGPQDFHAYVEVYLGDRWWIFDPSGTAIPTGFVRLGTGRDAADVPFCMIFGMATMTDMQITISAETGTDGKLREPLPTDRALSTDDGT